MKTEKDVINPILIVDDEHVIISGYKMSLNRKGIKNLICCTDSREALSIIENTSLELAILDLNMPFVSGEELLELMTEKQPDVPVIIVTGMDSVEKAVNCMKLGAYEFLVKPFKFERFFTSVKNARRISELLRENKLLSEKVLFEKIEHPEYFSEIITDNSKMKSIFSYIEAIAVTPNPVLITGETGTGKELFARSIHKASRRTGKFVSVNIAGLDDTMFSDTLFGHKKGAFTGADLLRTGLIARAKGGTLFLDEIGELSLQSQIKLLRLLQENEYLPLGQDNLVQSDARIIVATNANLSKMQEKGEFRPDLFYRLNTHKIMIPPLRNRYEDIEILVNHFLNGISEKLGKTKPTPPGELFALLSTFSFPGNVRELEAMITNALTLHTSKMLSLKTFKEYIDPSLSIFASEENNSEELYGELSFGEKLPGFNDVKKLLIEEAMKRTDGNQSRAAELIGTSRQTLRWYLKKNK